MWAGVKGGDKVGGDYQPCRSSSIMTPTCEVDNLDTILDYNTIKLTSDGVIRLPLCAISHSLPENLV